MKPLFLGKAMVNSRFFLRPSFWGVVGGCTWPVRGLYVVDFHHFQQKTTIFIHGGSEFSWPVPKNPGMS